MDPNPVQVKDFFISYNQADRAWAEWIASKLEDEGYTCIIQVWDFRPGGNFVLDMHHAAIGAQRIIAVLSPDYLNALYTQPEWAAAFVQDPTSKDGMLLPVRVRECKPGGVLAAIVYIDLVALDESKACTTLLAGVKRTRAKPAGPLPFPGGASSTPKLPVIFPGNWPEAWEVPYRRNPFFTGRDEVLKQLHEKLTAQKTMALTQQAQAISGLGGIGKTQTALEYANRHQKEYRYVLWVTAETAEGLSAEYVRLAQLLRVPGIDEKDQQVTIKTFKQWLASQRDGLLILDNADEVEMVRDFLPNGPQMKGHVLLTTRAQALGSIADVIDIEKMGQEEGVAFLLRRARVKSDDASEQTAAEAIVEELDGFPLALDQAGAYVEETGYSLTRYLNLYQTHRKDLMQRRGRLVKDHPETVATTWDISIQKVEQEKPAAVALLKLCAFLAPDAIEEEMIVKGTKYLGKELSSVVADELLLNEVIEVLRRYSLVKRNQATKALSIHRLVQAVLRDGMNSRMQRQWAARAVQVVSEEFPSGKYENWEQCRRYLPHAQICIGLIKLYGIEILEAAHLLHNIGCYFHEQPEYKQAEECYLQALSMKEKIVGIIHLETAKTLHELGSLSQDQGNYEQAKRYYEQALSMKEETVGMMHLETAKTLHELGSLSQDQGNYEQAKRYYEQALSIDEKTHGLVDPGTAATLYEQGRLYQNQGNYEQAKRYYEQALSIDEKTRGLEHPDTAMTLHEQGRLYHNQGDYEQAEALYKQALSIYEKTHGREHPNTAMTLYEQGRLYHNQGQYEQAEALYKQALSIEEKILGLEHPGTATSLDALAILYHDQYQYEQAEPLYQQALRIRERALELDHRYTKSTIKNYARLLYETNHEADAEALLARINLTLDDIYS
jgi:tetratricopeptide (TPR) repeat protein